MLLACPECNLQVSDKAVACPHCGYPMATEEKQKRRPRQTRRRRLPNGFGQISEIKGRNLRKPFRAMITVGKTDVGRPICKLLEPEAYFETYNEAYAALVEYNRSPYDISDSITMQELYERWSTEHFKTFESRSSEKKIRAAWNKSESIYKLKVRDVRARHIRVCIEESTATVNIKKTMKTLFNMMFDYAVEYEIAERNYAREFSLSKEITKEQEKNRKYHITFTEEEINMLWDGFRQGIDPLVDMVLIQCYSGWRPKELCELLIENIDLKQRFMVGGSKTEAGKNRIVPIHSKILPLIEHRMTESNSRYLFGGLSYDKYSDHFAKIRDVLGLNPQHRPHDCRVYFVTTAKKCGVDEYALKLMVGHAITDITEKVYTKRDSEWLRTEIEKIK